ncbi:hypothetical protein [Emticicia sp. BO119]|uniref:hypothetical protein n=1 Tax=Emticicia sp. BO119 TaxID=2757768 RepID=UPI0015F040D9|nr:hypothetical protein [Emticicia sp. BO119]MBA4853683.1 hypothetical protein [Emticicia sp. BO119]
MSKNQKLTSVNIRMYRQGFGDCFLLTFHYKNPKKLRHIMIDFGVLMSVKKNKGAKDKELQKQEKMKNIAKNILSKTKGKVDVLAVTHQHWDHFSGFTKSQAGDIISELEFEKLWLAWTEEENQTAAELKNVKVKIEDNIRLGVSQLKKDYQKINDDKPNLKRKEAFNKSIDNINQILAFEGTSENKKLTDILSKVWKGIKSKTVFHESGKIIDLDWGGIRIYVLGPPKEWDYLRKNESTLSGDLYLSDKILEMSTEANFNNPNSFMNSYLFADADKQKKWSNKDIPFDEHWALYKSKETTNEIEPYELENQALRESEQKKIIKNIIKSEVFQSYISDKPTNEIRRIDNDYLSYIEPLAMKLNNHTNNTSLVLAIEMIDSGKVLLFPGDAQYGNWLSWFEKKMEWDILKNGKKEKVTVEDLLMRTVFYKVSHHGSHNGTPQNKGLELMKDKNLIAAVPVNESDAKDNNWDKIPYNNIMKRLQQKAKIINGRPAILRSDIDFPSAGEIKEDQSEHKLYFDIIIKNE